VGGVGVKVLLAHLLVAAGIVLIVAAVVLLAGPAWALLTAGILTVAYGLLLVDLPARPLASVSPGPGDTARVGR
jgi:uncharacterized membrane protein HdeD (DUF308 family)